MLRIFPFLLTLGVCLLSVIKLPGQIVNSDCTPSPQFDNKHSDGLWNTAYAYLNELDSIKFAAETTLDSTLYQTIKRCASAVYNSQLPARDTIVNQLDISQFQPINLRQIELQLDTAHPWAAQFVKGNLSGTTNPFINDLVIQHGLTLDSITWMPPWVTTHQAKVRLKSTQFYNTQAIAKYFAAIDGVVFANAVTPSGDGSQIIYQYLGGEHILTFRYGWGNCPGGCTFKRDWRFKIYIDCSVEFVSSYGDELPLVAIQELPIDSWQVSPNPAQENVQITTQHDWVPGQYNITISSTQGSILWQEAPMLLSQNQYQIPVFDFPNGVYILKVMNQHSFGIQKIMIQR